MMADSDDDTANDGGDGLDLTSFMFGNIDQSGQLEEEFLDASTKKQLNSLGNLLSGTNLVSLAREVSIEAQDEDTDKLEETDFNEKAEDAEDFSNIDEMMDDDTSSEEDSDDDEEEHSTNNDIEMNLGQQDALQNEGKIMIAFIFSYQMKSYNILYFVTFR